MLRDSPSAGSTIFATVFNGGIYKSTDGGAFWTPAGLGNRNLWGVASTDSCVYAGEYLGGVHRTTNGGSTWTPLGPTGVTVRSLLAIGSRVFAGAYAGVYPSTDRGTTWQPVLLSSPRTLSIGRHWDKLYAGGFGGVSTTTDQGATWTFSGIIDWRITAVDVRGSVALAAAGAGGVFLSTNDGATWTERNNGLAGKTPCVRPDNGRRCRGDQAAYRHAEQRDLRLLGHGQELDGHLLRLLSGHRFCVPGDRAPGGHRGGRDLPFHGQRCLLVSPWHFDCAYPVGGDEREPGLCRVERERGPGVNGYGAHVDRIRAGRGHSARPCVDRDEDLCRRLDGHLAHDEQRGELDRHEHWPERYQRVFALDQRLRSLRLRWAVAVSGNDHSRNWSVGWTRLP